MDPRKRFEVEITFQQTVRYGIEAANRKEAERIALERWQEGDESAATGSECCRLLSVAAAAIPAEEGLARDAERVLRWLRDRELVIERLDDDAFSPSVHDAVSAEDVAAHFGWQRRPADAPRDADVPRAERALEKLCADRRVVCFERARVRAGERGEIRLYCTPQHLERLSALLEAPAAV